MLGYWRETLYILSVVKRKYFGLFTCQLQFCFKYLCAHAYVCMYYKYVILVKVYCMVPIYIFYHKYPNRLAWANSIDPDHTAQNVASDQGLHYLTLIQQFFKHMNRYAHRTVGPRKLITKTRLFKYIENFSSKNWKVSDKNKYNIFHIPLKT